MNTEIMQEQEVQKTTGMRLRQARERLGFTRQVVAERLCLTASTIRSIEEDKAQSNLAPLFFRGYVRSYARLVQLPEDDLLAALKSNSPVLTPKIAPMQTVSRKKRKKRDGWLIYFTWLIVIIVLSLTGAWWWQNHKAQQEEIASMVDNSAAQQGDHPPVPVAVSATGIDSETSVKNVDNKNNTPTGIDIVATDSQNSVIAQPSYGQYQHNDSVAGETHTNGISPFAIDTDRGSEAVASDQSAVITANVVPDITVVDPDALMMDFSADCWLQVTDASGKTLFNGIQQAGTKLNLVGKEPYKLIIGAPSAVQIQYQGNPVDLSRFVKTNRTARLMIPAQ